MGTTFKNASTLVVDAGANTISRLSGQDAKGANTSTSLSVSYPGATTSGNLLLASVHASSSGTLAAPSISGWTNAGVLPFSSNSNSVSIFYKISDGTETSITVTHASTSSVSTQLHIYEYTNVGNPVTLDIAFTGTTGSGTSLAIPAFSTTNSRGLIFATWSVATGAVTSPAVTVLNLRQQDTSIRLFDADLIPNALQSSITPTGSWTTSRACGVAYVAIIPSYPSLTPGWVTTVNASASAAQSAFSVYDYMNSPVDFIGNSSNKSVVVFGDGYRSTNDTVGAGFYGRSSASKPALMVFPQSAGTSGGPRITSGSGDPNLVFPGTATEGDIWLRTDTPNTSNQLVYQCTTGGTSPGTWTARL